jgi:hypothetical protein
MHTRDLSKSQRRKIRELSALAHDRELSAELGKLEEAFRRWRSGELDPHQLNDLIHAFHQGPSRKLFSRYADSDSTLPVAAAVAHGIIADTEVPEDVLSVLHSDIAFLRDEHDTNGEP